MSGMDTSGGRSACIGRTDHTPPLKPQPCKPRRSTKARWRSWTPCWRLPSSWRRRARRCRCGWSASAASCATRRRYTACAACRTTRTAPCWRATTAATGSTTTASASTRPVRYILIFRIRCQACHHNAELPECSFRTEGGLPSRSLTVMARCTGNSSQRIVVRRVVGARADVVCFLHQRTTKMTRKRPRRTSGALSAA